MPEPLALYPLPQSLCLGAHLPGAISTFSLCDVHKSKGDTHTFGILTQESGLAKPRRFWLEVPNLTCLFLLEMVSTPALDLMTTPPTHTHTIDCTIEYHSMAGISLACGWGFYKIECFHVPAGQDQKSQMTGWPASLNPGSSGLKSEIQCFLCVLLPGSVDISWGISQGNVDHITSPIWTQCLWNQSPTDKGMQFTPCRGEAVLCERKI